MLRNPSHCRRVDWFSLHFRSPIITITSSIGSCPGESHPLVYMVLKSNVILQLLLTQSKTPFAIAFALVSPIENESLSMFSITGVCTRVGSSAIRANIGSNHLLWHSQCASKNTITSPWAALAPVNRAFINPCRSGCRISLTVYGIFEQFLQWNTFQMSKPFTHNHQNY